MLRDYTLELPYKKANEEQARKPAMCLADKGEPGRGEGMRKRDYKNGTLISNLSMPL